MVPKCHQQNLFFFVGVFMLKSALVLLAFVSKNAFCIFHGVFCAVLFPTGCPGWDLGLN